jgi:hypothetical protein
VNYANVTIARDHGKCEYRRNDANHLHERVYLAERFAQSPVGVYGQQDLNPDAREQNGKIAYRQIQNEQTVGSFQGFVPTCHSNN